MALLSRSGAGAGRHLSSHFIAFAWGMSIALVCKNLTILQTTVADRSRGVQSGRPYADESISGNNTGISLVISYCNGKMSNYRKVFASTSLSLRATLQSFQNVASVELMLATSQLKYFQTKDARGTATFTGLSRIMTSYRVSMAKSMLYSSSRITLKLKTTTPYHWRNWHRPRKLTASPAFF